MNLKIPTAILSLTVAAFPAKASLVIHDAFDEPTTTVSTTSAPAGWVTDEPANAGANHGYVKSGSLSYPGLEASTGNSFGLGDKTADYTRTLSVPTLGDGDAVYVSFLIELNSPLDSFASGSLRLWNSANGTGGGLQVGWGTSDHTTNKMGFSLSDRNRDFSSAVSADLQKTGEVYDIADTTHFVVMGYNRGANAGSSSVSLWVDPTNFGGTAPTETITYSDIASFTHGDMADWDRLEYISNGSGSAPTGGFSLDEIRVGTTWADVTPIPEPSSLVLLFGAFAALAAACRRRRA